VSRLNLPVLKALSEGTQVKPPPLRWVECNRRNSPMSFARLQTRTRHSSAFTLVELMIVIAIVGILASLVTVGVMKALERAKDVSARLEISQIEAAIAAAKQKLNLNGLPTYLVIYENFVAFNAAATNPANPDYIGASAALALLSKIYESNNPLDWNPTTPTYKDWNGNGSQDGRIELFGSSALLFLLGGEIEATITNGSKLIPKYRGFILKSPKKPKGPFYEPSGNVWANSANYFSIYDSNQTPYAYFDSGDYKNCFDNGQFSMNPKPPHPLFALTSAASIKPYCLKYLPSVLHPNNPSQGAISWVNPRSFQLISAGKDQTFGKNFYINPGYPTAPPTPYSASSGVYTGTHLTGEPLPYVAGEGCWKLAVLSGEDASLTTGYDDISNFASSFLGKKDE